MVRAAAGRRNRFPAARLQWQSLTSLTHGSCAEAAVICGCPPGAIRCHRPRLATSRTDVAALEREGLARELISAVQRLRKEAHFAVSDRIRLTVGGDAAVRDAATEHREWIAGETLAREFIVRAWEPNGTEPDQGFDVVRTLDLDGRAVRTAITRD